MQIAGKTFLITGGASGLGAACAERFARQQANVVIADVDEESGQLWADHCGASLGFCKVDVTSPDDVEQAIKLASEMFGGLHVVVNCAGILGASRVVTRDGPHDLELFSRVIQVNLVGTFNVITMSSISPSRPVDQPSFSPAISRTLGR